MITITCTNCQTQLTMDEAFAGGVCRCQHCGTIQTVPKANRGSADASSGLAHQTGGSAKTLWRQSGSGESTGGTGLDDLADIVASSGLAGSGLQSKRLRRSAPPVDPVASRKKLIRMLSLIAGGVLAVLLIIAYIVTRPDAPTEDPTTPHPGTIAGTNNPPIPTVSGPSFCGVKLEAASTVIYVLDRGSGTSNVFGELKAATLKSARSLTASRKFQIIFWQVRGESITVPDVGTTVAGDISIAEAGRKLDDVSAFGSSSVGPSIKKAAAAKPDAIIIATGKGDDLDDTFVKNVLDNAPAGTKIHTFALGSNRASPQLQSIANKTGGEYRTITEAQLSAMAK